MPYARTLPGTPVPTLWRAHARVGGEINGIPFHLSPGTQIHGLNAGTYQTGELTNEQAALLYGHSSVEVVISRAVPMPAPITPVAVKAPVVGSGTVVIEAPTVSQSPAPAAPVTVKAPLGAITIPPPAKRR